MLEHPPNAAHTKVSDAIWYGDAGQTGATIERIVSDTGNAVGNDNSRQAAAGLKNVASDSRDAVQNCDIGNSRGVPKCTVPNVDHVAWNSHRAKMIVLESEI